MLAWRKKTKNALPEQPTQESSGMTDKRIVDAEAPSARQSLSLGSDRLRETTKWLVASYGAIGASLVIGSQFSDMGHLEWGDQRLYAAILGVVFGFCGIAFALWSATGVFLAGAVSLHEIASAPTGGRKLTSIIRRRLEQDPTLMEGYPDLTTLEHAYAMARTNQRTLREAVPPEGATLEEITRMHQADALAETIQQTVDPLLVVASNWLVVETFRRARLGLLVGAVAAGIGIGVFAWAAHPPA